MPNISVIGLGICQPPLLNEKARLALSQCDCVMGSLRQLASIKGLVETEGPQQRVPKTLELPKLKDIAKCVEGFDKVVILASGDPLLFGIGKYLQSLFADQEDTQVDCISGVSSLQGACELTGVSLQDAQLVSLHGRPLNHLKRHLQPNRNLLILTDQYSHPQAIAKTLVAANLAESVVHVCERLGYEDQKYQQFVASQLEHATQNFDSLHVTLVQTLGQGHVQPSFVGIADEHFITDGEAGKGLLTKREVRLNILSLLQPTPGDVGFDIGAGCGGVAIEWALWNPLGQVIAIEHHANRIDCLNANIEKFGVSANLRLSLGKAPDQLTQLPNPNKVFIGGSGGQLPAILTQAWQRLQPGGRLVASAVTEQTKATLREFTNLIGQQPNDYFEVAISRHDQIAGQDILRPALPVTLMSWHKPLEISHS